MLHLFIVHFVFSQYLYRDVDNCMSDLYLLNTVFYHYNNYIVLIYSSTNENLCPIEYNTNHDEQRCVSSCPYLCASEGNTPK